MRAGLRIGAAALAAGLMLAPASAFAQTSPTTNAPASTPEVPDFTLNGTVTRRETPPPEPQAPAARPADPAPRTAPTPSPQTAPLTPSERATPPARSVTVELPPPGGDILPAPTEPISNFTTQPSSAPEVVPPEASLPVDGPAPMLPWLLAALVAALGLGFYAWRKRSRLAVARSGAALENFVPAEPPVVPQPRAAEPLPPPAPSTAGLVSSRLRPWLELDVVPIRCILDEQKATLEFQVTVFNSGSAPARDVLVEACMFNAGPAQDQEIGAFFEHPVAKGQRIAAIPPLSPLSLTSAVTLTREQISQFDVAGRQLFVPMLAFNALYRWSGGEAQTSVSYLVGRDTKSEKLAPLRLDLGPRIFRGLGLREHHLRVRK